MTFKHFFKHDSLHKQLHNIFLKINILHTLGEMENVIRASVCLLCIENMAWDFI